MRPVDDLLRTIGRLLLVMIVIAVTLPMVGSVIRSAVGASVHGANSVIGGVVSPTIWVLFLLFLVGLIARVMDWSRGRSGKDRQGEARRTRLSVRRRAEDVPPAIPAPRLPDDPDPPLGSRGA